ncbi:SDR family oxidoreductase [Dactylosporangium sp. AC04546]|uniref:SDR family oxidoreductase n=1 Tax=Dactylosporangium sp. AC04546 TaxID=2862460 RepID=UPI001EDD0B79|nr:SDR family oxidoreductase [Dactylosporangium sp. AC04546]WVK89400.1 SDR family oxidoreductase [Dactylosporangium sp. AC04546]
MTRVMITGATGHLGKHVARHAALQGWTVVGTYLRAPSEHATERLDIRDREAASRTVAEIDPDIVIHTAAGRDRDDWTANADGAANVAVAAQGRRLIHISSDALFSGRDGEYDEDALPDPIHRYGASKAAAETAVRAIAPQAAIVRTSLIIGHGEGGHERLTHAGGTLFTNEIRKPVHVDDLAGALVELAGTGYAGVLNLAGHDAISRYHLGILVARRDGLDEATILAAEAGPGRPTDVRLTTDRATALLRTRLRGAHEFMAPAA